MFNKYSLHYLPYTSPPHTHYINDISIPRLIVCIIYCIKTIWLYGCDARALLAIYALAPSSAVHDLVQKQVTERCE